MSFLYILPFDPSGLTQKEQNLTEHRMGRELLLKALREQYGLSFAPDVPETKLRDSVSPISELPEIDLLESELHTGEHGKPYLKDHPDIHFSISHCDRMIVCAVSNSEIGVDAEREGRFVEAVLRKTLTGSEREFFDRVSVTPELRARWFIRFWTLKEAYVKLTGTGITVPLTSFSFTFEEDRIAGEDLMAVPSGTGVRTVPKGTIHCSDETVNCTQFRLSSGHIISVCHRDDSCDIRCQTPLHGV